MLGLPPPITPTWGPIRYITCFSLDLCVFMACCRVDSCLFPPQCLRFLVFSEMRSYRLRAPAGLQAARPGRLIRRCLNRCKKPIESLIVQIWSEGVWCPKKDFLAFEGFPSGPWFRGLAMVSVGTSVWGMDGFGGARGQSY